MKRILAAAIIAVFVLTTGVAAAQPTPEITTRQLLDRIAESKGKVVLINFFAAFCPPCRKEIPGLIRIRSEVPADDLVIIGIAVDQDEAAMEAFIAKNDFNYPVFHAKEELAFAFRVDAIPHNLVYDRAGRVVYNEAGYVPEGRFKAMLLQWIQAK